MFTERYNGGFDQTVLSDSYSISDCFYDDIKTKVINMENGVTGDCMFYTDESKLPNTSVYLTKTNLFIYDDSPLKVETDDGIFLCGYYNQNAKFDKKGAYVAVQLRLLLFHFQLTNEDGTSELTTIGASEQLLFNTGVTLFHGYRFRYSTSPMTAVTNALNIALSPQNAIPLDLKHRSGRSEGTVVNNPYSQYNAIIQVYESPREGTKNSIKVYRINAIRSFDVLFPASPGGIEAYIGVNGVADNYPAGAATHSVQVTTNVDFKVVVPSGVNWITVQGGPTFSKNTGTVAFSLTENTGSTQRSATITFESVDDVKYDPTTETMTKYTVQVTIRQLGSS